MLVTEHALLTEEADLGGVKHPAVLALELCAVAEDSSGSELMLAVSIVTPVLVSALFRLDPAIAQLINRHLLCSFTMFVVLLIAVAARLVLPRNSCLDLGCEIWHESWGKCRPRV